MWRQPTAIYVVSNILETIPFGSGSVMVSHGCMLDLDTVQGSLNGPRYQRDTLETIVFSHFDNHALAMKPVFMDDNARPHRMHAVINFPQ